MIVFLLLQNRGAKTTSSEHVVYTNCFLFWHSEQFMYTTCSELVVFMYWARNSMNNLLSYFGLIDARISASEKDLCTCTTYELKRFMSEDWSQLHYLSDMDLFSMNIIVCGNLLTRQHIVQP